MAEKILLDTSVLIEIFDYGKGKDLLRNECAISIVSVYEYMRYKDKAEETMELLENAFDIIPLDDIVILSASNIFKKLKEKGTMVNENDIYIAASAIAYGLRLYTKDSDFLKIKNVFKTFKLAIK
ncbi:MAG: type II toxin-antitoxin system VapC family toxin [Candidatus Marsarchaeota archaeon]|nr:type II toxin-antitoxin system VapC family toxin [Candidatus Marsarchaeota archaeon]